MKNESTITREIMKEVAKKINGQIFKHSDRFTKGVPDVSITVNGVTTWFEFKLAENKNIFEPIQVAIIKRLVRAYLIVWDRKINHGVILSGNILPLKNDGTGTAAPSLSKEELVKEITRLAQL